MPRNDKVWEISRFAALCRADGMCAFSETPIRMMQVAVAFAHQRGIEQFVAVTTPAIERMLRSIGVRSQRWSAPTACGVAQAVVLCFDLDQQLDCALQAARAQVERKVQRAWLVADCRRAALPAPVSEDRRTSPPLLFPVPPSQIVGALT